MHRFKLFCSSFAAAVGAWFLFAGPSVAQVTTVSACSISDPPADCEGMWATSISVRVPNGAYVHVADPGCMNDAAAELTKVLAAAAEAQVPGISRFAGPITTAMDTEIKRFYRANGGGDFGRLTSPYAKNGALCAPIALIVPVDSRIEGFRFEAAESGGGYSRCRVGADCGIGWSKYQAQPIVRSNSAMKTVTAIFMNWSHDRTRRAKMTVFLRGERPLSEL